ncbi:MAG: hypothetical protein ACRDK5_03955, partial [Solirubrobacterales bacterium]
GRGWGHCSSERDKRRESELPPHSWLLSSVEGQRSHAARRLGIGEDTDSGCGKPRMLRRASRRLKSDACEPVI